jgi:hypothetical protein
MTNLYNTNSEAFKGEGYTSKKIGFTYFMYDENGKEMCRTKGSLRNHLTKGRQIREALNSHYLTA